MANDALSKQFKAYLDEWGDAIASKRHDWLEELFPEDFLGTAQPWPTLSVDKQKMIDLDKAIEVMDVTWVDVTVHQVGEEVVLPPDRADIGNFAHRAEPVRAADRHLQQFRGRAAGDRTAKPGGFACRGDCGWRAGHIVQDLAAAQALIRIEKA